MNILNAARAAPIRGRFRQAAVGTGVHILQNISQIDPLFDFACSTLAGLSSKPYHLPCRFLYDDTGSALFELITRQPEYYLTRTEAALLAAHAERIREITGPVPLMELGSGSAEKTDYLLRAWKEAWGKERRGGVFYIPIDVSESALVGACRNISASHPAVRVIGLHTEYHHAFPLLWELSQVLVLLLGSSIGNFSDNDMPIFLDQLGKSLKPGDRFLLGIDLVKDPCLLEAAYNDAAGVTARFTINLFARMNRELGSRIDLSAVRHVARYNEMKEQIEINALFTRRQTILIAPFGEGFAVDEGEMVLTEISRKFRLDTFLPYLEGFGFAIEEVFTDPSKFFALILMRRTETPP